jgi:hypothetical protein
VSKPDKHTPLSPEELVKLLEDNSGKATDFDGMDDFEKEALEGFTSYSTPKNARAMMEEVNLAVSKKVNEGTGTKKNRVIWFSAAASIVLLVILSVFFLNEGKKDSASNVAVLDVKASPTAQPVAPDETITAAEPMDEKKEESKQAAGDALSGKKVFEQDLANRLEAQDTKPGAGISREIVSGDTKTLEESEKVSSTSDNTFALKGNVDAQKNDEAKDAGALKKSELDDLSKLVAVSPAVNTKNQTESANGYASPAPGSTNNTAVTTISQNGKSYDVKITAEKAAAEKASADKAAKELAVERAAKNSKAKEKAPAYKTADSEMDQEVETAYYKGGELAIKEYVVSYLQKKGVTITGTYKVKANVLTNGSLKVKFVNHTTSEYCKDCENILKKALGEMTGWTPAMWGKTASESSVDFVLSF